MSNIFWNCALKYGVVLSCPPRLFPHGSVLQAPYIYIYIYIHTYGIFFIGNYGTSNSERRMVTDGDCDGRCSVHTTTPSRHEELWRYELPPALPQHSPQEAWTHSRSSSESTPSMDWLGPAAPPAAADGDSAVDSPKSPLAELSGCFSPDSPHASPGCFSTGSPPAALGGATAPTASRIIPFKERHPPSGTPSCSRPVAHNSDAPMGFIFFFVSFVLGGRR